MDTKHCSKCNINLELNYFYNGRNICKKCCIEKSKLYHAAKYLDQKSLILEQKRQYYLNNSEKILSKKKIYATQNANIIAHKNKLWYEQNKNTVIYKLKRRKANTEYVRNRKTVDPLFKISQNLRSRMWHALKNNQKSGSAISDLGCSIAKLKIHLQLQFHRNPRGEHQYMDWNNYGKWHIDHIQPLSCFDLMDPEQFKKACHYSNLQPMWARDNILKSDNSY